MLNLRKVMSRWNSEDLTDEEKQKRAQKEYEDKVKGLLECCKKFDKYLTSTCNDSDRWHLKFKEIFKDYLESKKLFSRTRSVLKDIYKNFQYYTVKEYPLIKGDFTKYMRPRDPNDFSLLEFKPKNANSRDYIKRSAIDDADVALYFNSTLPNSLFRAYRQQPQSAKNQYRTGSFEQGNAEGSSLKSNENLSDVEVKRNIYVNGERIYNVGKSELSDQFINSKKITIPSGVKVIPGHAFEHFHKLEELVIPYGVKAIQERAFFGCENLKSIVFYSSPNVFNDAFACCGCLKEMSFLNVPPKFQWAAFGEYKYNKVVTTIKIRKKSDIYVAQKAVSTAFENAGRVAAVKLG